MKKCIGFILFFLISFTVLSQSSEKKHKWSISGFYYPEYSFRIFTHSDKKFFDMPSWEDIEKNHLPKYGYSSGVMVTYSINKRFGIKTGLSFTESGQLYRTDWKYEGGGIYKEFCNLKYESLNIPVKINISLINSEHFSMFCDIGAHPALVFYFGDVYRTETDLLNYSTTFHGSDYPTQMKFGCWSSIECGFVYKYKKFFVGLNAGYKIDVVPIKSGSKDYIWYDYYFYNAGGGVNMGYTL